MSETNDVPIATTNDGDVSDEKEIIEQLSLKLLQQTELTNVLQQRIADFNRQLNQQKQLLTQARKEKHEADLEVTRLSTEVENITEELFEQANNQVKEANEDAYNTKKLNDRLSNTIKEKDTTIEILQSELSNLKNIISNMDTSSSTPMEDPKRVTSNKEYFDLKAPLNDQTVEDPFFPSCAILNSPLLSPFNRKPIYAPYYNQLRFDLPAFRLFSDSLLPFLTQCNSENNLASNSHKNSVSSTIPTLFDIRTTKFFTKLIDELEEDLRLDKAPSLQTLKLRWNRKIFLQELMDKTVTIEPLSAATEAWKSQTLQKYIPAPVPVPTATSSTPLASTIPQPESSASDALPPLSRYSTSTSSTSSYDPTLFKLATNSSDSSSTPDGVAPLAVTSSCGLCGERRRDMNFSRLYRIRISSSENNNNPEDRTSTKADYPLCINCANRYRAVVELLKFIATIDPRSVGSNDDLDDYIRGTWAKVVGLKAKVWYAVNIGIWSDKESFGLVYGWQNDWLSNTTVNKTIEIEKEIMEPLKTNEALVTADSDLPLPVISNSVGTIRSLDGESEDGIVEPKSEETATINSVDDLDVNVSKNLSLKTVSQHSSSVTETIQHENDDEKPTGSEEDEHEFEDALEGEKSKENSIYEKE